MTTSTDSKFFTNEPGNNLYNRFDTILKHDTQFFDVLVGYFRTSGFFKMYKSMEGVEKIRILVGLNVDNYTVKIVDKAKEEIVYEEIDKEKGIEIIGTNVEEEYAHSNVSYQAENGVRTFIEWLKSGKLEMRLFTEAPLHAKVYIMRKSPDYDYYGSVITGSSNFSLAGLQNNLEFNVELKDKVDVVTALERFEELWDKATDIKDAFIETVNTKTWIRDDITPYEIYLKTLYEFFKEEINYDKEAEEIILPGNNMRLQYQLDAVTQARKTLEAYNGVFIADVVGLGKTYICSMLAATLPRDKYKLIVCPPLLINEWKKVLNQYGVTRFEVVSLGKLSNLIVEGKTHYDYVFVDEAHRFRNDDANMYTDLHTICRDKKVVLISATPINNWTKDIENLIYLFQDKHAGTINGVKNIERFFAELDAKLKKYPKNTPAYWQQLRENSEVIRDRLVRHVMIRRTRSEISKYYAVDLQKQNLTFPTLEKPQRIIYTLDAYTNNAFNETIEKIKSFSYARYTPLLYLIDQKKYATALVAQRNMCSFMKGLLLKRLESSFYAFKQTLGRFIESYEKFLAMYESGVLYVSKAVNVYDLWDEGSFEKLQELTGKNEAWCFDADEFNDDFIKNLYADLDSLKYMKSMWDKVLGDPKLEKFKEELAQNEILKGKKLILFTESRETAEYLYEELKPIFGDTIIEFSASTDPKVKIEIEDSFNPNNSEKNNDKYDVLITTDVLAEGINLHKASVIINYDLPWNPTRVMQRVGRINRVGTTFDKIYVFNFFPTAQSSSHMPLEERILEKIQAFHDTLGEDSQYLSDKEEVSPKRLFDELNNISEEETVANPELQYLAYIREIRDNHTTLYNKIKRLPRKAKSSRFLHLDGQNATLSFIRKGSLKKFLLCQDGLSKELSFLDAVKLLAVDEKEKRAKFDKTFFEQADINDAAFDDLLLAEDEVTAQSKRISGNDAKVVKDLKGLYNLKELDEEQIKKLRYLQKLLEKGELPAAVSRAIVKRLNGLMGDFSAISMYNIIIDAVPKAYWERKKARTARVDGVKQVVLSCYMVEDK